MDPFQGIGAVRGHVEKLGWIERESDNAFYASARNDCRPLTYLRPEKLDEVGVGDSVNPCFFVYVDVDPDVLRMTLSHTETSDVGSEFGRKPDLRRTSVTSMSSELIELEHWKCRLSLVLVDSNVLEARKVAVLQIWATNDEVAEMAQREGWAPEVFVGICDGCRGFGVDPDLAYRLPSGPNCTNLTGPADRVFPAILGSRYWLTDHLTFEPSRGPKPVDGDPLKGLEVVELAGGIRLRRIFRWLRWPGDGNDSAAPALYEIDRSGHWSVDDSV